MFAGICWMAMDAALSALANIDAPVLAATSSGGLCYQENGRRKQ